MKTKELARLVIKFEEWKLNGEENGKSTFTVSIYTENGDYIGSLDGGIVKLLHDEGILPEKANSEHNVCSIGKSLKNGKWYGWSHRAIAAFKIGDVVKEGDCCATSGYTEEYLKDHPDEKVLPVGFKAETEEDCIKMAIAFASSVS